MRAPLTGGAVVHQGAQGLAVPPVAVEVVDGHLGHLVLDPSQQALLGGQLAGVLLVLVLPHGHGDGVVQDQRPDQTQDQLQVPVHDGFGVWGGSLHSEDASIQTTNTIHTPTAESTMPALREQLG